LQHFQLLSKIPVTFAICNSLIAADLSSLQGMGLKFYLHLAPNHCVCCSLVMMMILPLMWPKHVAPMLVKSFTTFLLLLLPSWLWLTFFSPQDGSKPQKKKTKKKRRKNRRRRPKFVTGQIEVKTLALSAACKSHTTAEKGGSGDCLDNGRGRARERERGRIKL